MSTQEVTICILTHHRPDGLVRLLQSIEALDAPTALAWSETIVVDNDSQGSAEPVVEQARETHPVPLRYVIEPTPGVSSARNRAVEETASRYMAFIDDDMTATTGWLHGLAQAMVRHNAVCVVGAVPIEYETPPPEGLRESGALDFPNWPDGTTIDTLRTGNALFDLANVGKSPFDLAFSLSGGEDHLLGRRLSAEGKSIVFVEGAEAIEWTPAERLTEEALKDRQRRLGYAFATVDLSMARGTGLVVAFTRHMALGVARVGAGLLLQTPGFPSTRRWRGHQLRWFGIGQLGALVGRKERYYQA